jgi:competence protein ComEA
MDLWDFKYRGRNLIPYILGFCGVLCLAAAFAAVISLRGFAGRTENAVPVPDEFVLESDGQGEFSESGVWVVYVTGAVMVPGVYEIPSGGRVHDAVKMAGGFLSNADRSGVNMAEIAGDGVQIDVPYMETNLAERHDAEGGVKPPVRAGPRGQAASPGASKKQAVSGRININSATESELENLPGIGPVLSAAIVAYRESSGAFIETADLMKVNGIGKKRFDAIRDLVTVSGQGKFR